MVNHKNKYLVAVIAEGKHEIFEFPKKENRDGFIKALKEKGWKDSEISTAVKH